ncbi:hypothetical protein ACFWMT_01010 [Streptomyces sp. NPDC058368]|uniref:hypothetical protein n=1 Tax=Streptomyces sp. NPDC058368 TaxID=3346461 RepID=UPI0036667B6D
MPVYPNRERALRHVKRTRAAYLYGRFPQRYILGMPWRPPRPNVQVQLRLDQAAGSIITRDLIQKMMGG